LAAACTSSLQLLVKFSLLSVQIVECIKSNKLHGSSSSSSATQQRTTVIQPDGKVKNDRFWGYRILLQHMPEDVAAAVRLYLSREIPTSSTENISEQSTGHSNDEDEREEDGNSTAAAAAAASAAATQAAIAGALVQPPETSKRRRLHLLFDTLDKNNKEQLPSGNPLP